MLLIHRKLLGQAERSSSRDNSNLVYRVRPRNQFSHQSMAGFMISSIFLLLIAYDHTSSFYTHKHLVLSVFQIRQGNLVFIRPCRIKRCFINQVFYISAGKTGRPPGNNRKVYIGFQLDLLDVHLEYLLSSLDIRKRNHHLPVKSSGS